MASVIDFAKAKARKQSESLEEEELTIEQEDMFEAAKRQNKLTEQRLRRERKFCNDRLKRELGMGNHDTEEII